MGGGAGIGCELLSDWRGGATCWGRAARPQGRSSGSKGGQEVLR